MQAAKLIVLTGPSGVGKGTLVRSLLQRHRELHLSVSATTRTSRPGEIEGKDYYFLSREQFEDMIQAGELLEWAEYAGNYYGTLRSSVEKRLAQGKSVVLEVEVVGARKIQQSFPDALRIFILPPSMQQLERRLRSRGNDSEEAVARRLECAHLEIAAQDEFDQQIVNHDLETALQEIEAVIFSTELPR